MPTGTIRAHRWRLAGRDRKAPGANDDREPTVADHAPVTLFALLHGGMHHGSSWDLVVDELTSRGHQVVAPDLPVADDGAGAREWAQVAIDAVEQTGHDDVIVVGHSIAGLCVPVVAALHPVRRMVFVGGLLPVPGQRFVDHLADNPDAISFPAGENSGSGPFGLTWESVRAGFYHDCPESLARQAFDELRGQSFTVFTERCPLECWPDVPSSYVLMRHDRAVGQFWARRNALDRVGATMIEMDGGHSPFFACPTELGDVLAGVAEAGV